MPLPLSQSLSVFLAGAVVLFIEIAGSKLLAVVFGSSLYVWSALITVTLLSLAVGAWLGGRIADRWPVPRTLAKLFLGASLTMGVAVPLRSLAFPLADRLDLRLGTFLSALLLFFLPLAFLAAVTPVVIKLAEPAREKLGRTVGWLSAIGTAGSCFGALATGYFLVPNFSLARLFLYFSFALALTAVLLWRQRKVVPAGALVALWAGCLWLMSGESRINAMGLHDNIKTLDVRQNLYGQTQVLEANAVRLLFLDGILQGGSVTQNGVSISEYTAAVELLGRGAVPNAKSALVIGIGAGVLPARFHAAGLDMDAVDINPQVVEMCRKWFTPAIPSERLIAEDGRRFLRKTSKTYDLIVLDVYSGEEIASHLVTREAFEEARRRLSPDGALLLNYVGFAEPTASRVVATLLATLKSVFPTADAYLVADSGRLANIAVISRMKAGEWAPTADVPWALGGNITLSRVLSNHMKTAEPYPFLFTDDYCPLDFLDREVRFAWRREKIKAMELSSWRR